MSDTTRDMLLCAVGGGPEKPPVRRLRLVSTRHLNRVCVSMNSHQACWNCSDRTTHYGGLHHWNSRSVILASSPRSPRLPEQTLDGRRGSPRTGPSLQAIGVASVSPVRLICHFAANRPRTAWRYISVGQPRVMIPRLPPVMIDGDSEASQSA